MANALIAPALPAQGVNQVVCPFFDPRFARANRGQYIREVIPELRLANSLMLPGGRYPARGFFLLRRGDLDNLNDKFREDFQLAFDDFLGGAMLLGPFALVQARCVSRGLASDPDALYLVEVTDGRGLVWNRFYQFPLNQQYNVLAPAYPGQCYADSLVLGVLWNYNSMLGNIWDKMETPLGAAWPGLPVSITDVPTNQIYPGVPAWPVLCEHIERFGLTVGVNPIVSAANPTPPTYTLPILGADDPLYNALVAGYQSNLEDDLEWIDSGSGRAPGTLVIYFHRANEYYGTEETVRLDSLQWTTNAYYGIAATAPPPYSGSVGVDFLWDDFVVRFDNDGKPVAVDVAQANLIALGRLNEYFRRIIRGTSGSKKQTYAGLVPFLPGSQLDGVRWYMDHIAGRLSWRTEIVSCVGPPWPEVDPRPGV
jgi:hypothetical protein